MEERTGKKVPLHLDGPGKLTKALGIQTDYNATSLVGEKIWLENKNLKIDNSYIKTGPRIGIDYAGKDVNLPYRFLLKDISILKNIKF